jgi:hypothetical protein
MSWASIYWDLDYIVQAARAAMESAYSVELAAQLTMSDPASAAPLTEKSMVENLSTNLSGSNANVDPLKIAETALSIGKPASVKPDQEIIKPKAADSLEVSLSKSSLAAKPLAGNKASVQVRSPWTTEIEAALREFLRPLSINLRYEYRFADTLDEKRSIATMNSLFKQRVKPDDIEIRDVSARDEVRRKRNHELRKSGAFDTNQKRSSAR